MPRFGRRPSSVEPEILERLRALLFSWKLREARGTVRCVPTDPPRAEWQDVFEELRGDGAYADRQTELNKAIASMDARGVQLAPVVSALESAWWSEWQHLLSIGRNQCLRWVSDRRTLRRQQLIGDYVDAGGDPTTAARWADRTLATDPLLNGKFPFSDGHHRLPSTNVPRPWVDEARAAIRAAGATVPEADTLLTAIGVLRRRTRVKPSS